MTTEVTADANNQNVDVNNEDKGVETPETGKPEQQTPEQIQARLDDLQAELVKKEELLKKVRKFEKENKDAAEKALAEQGKFKELYEQEVQRRSELEGKMKDSAITSAINDALKDSGAISTTTVAKLLDKSKIGFEDGVVDIKSVQALISELKTSDPVLFQQQQTQVPPTKKAAEGDPVGGFEKEIRAATTQKQIEAVMRKYGKLG